MKKCIVRKFNPRQMEAYIDRDESEDLVACLTLAAHIGSIPLG